jgi:hypothetical protein
MATRGNVFIRKCVAGERPSRCCGDTWGGPDDTPHSTYRDRRSAQKCRWHRGNDCCGGQGKWGFAGGVEVTVEKVDLTDDDQIVVICTRGRSRQSIPILELPLPSPPPKGAEWIDAYRRWARGK